MDAAGTLGAPVVVMHPPFRWQRAVRRRRSPTRSPGPDESAGVALAVENMFPVGRGPVRAVPYRPGYDPTAVGYPHYTLDLSHTAAAGSDALAMLERMGDRLAHVHLADGTGGPRDEHLVPGRGGQPCARGLRAAGRLRVPRAAVVVEVSTRRCRTRDERAGLLHEALLFARLHLQADGRRAGPVTPLLPCGPARRAARRRPVRRPARHRTGRSARRRTAAC